MRRTFTAVAALSVAMALCAPAGSASADDPAASTVEITKAKGGPGGTDIKGKVKSGKKNCKKYRKVKVYHDVAPPGPSSGDFLLGTVETNRKGKWGLSTPFAPDKVYATVKGTPNCEKDTSSTETVD